ncbi:MAG: hypothetical protein AAF330_04575 [Pseudomonadota bacterium]
MVGWFGGRRAGRVVALGILALMMTAGAGYGVEAPLIVQNDRGGGVMARAQEISALRLGDRRVELRGSCFSACTMYLGLAKTCVHPDATLGFHGARRQSETEAMPRSLAAQLVAAHYPALLQRWYLSEGQYIPGDRVARLSGQELIDMGVPRC